jgi:anaerobic glycerol-3-phosphate dehydrogenase
MICCQIFCDLLLKSAFEQIFNVMQLILVQIKYLTADHSVFPYSNANDMRVTQDLNSFREIIAHAHCAVDGKKKKNHVLFYFNEVLY